MSSIIMGDDGDMDLGLGSPGRDLMDDYDPSDRFDIFMPAVQSLVNALGGYEEVETPAGSGNLETIYRPGDSVLAVLKDLKKLWRKDDSDDERTVARCMAKAGLMKELVALLVECTERGDWGRKVALVACDLIAALTWPIDVAAELKEMADEPDIVTDYASLLRAQVEYKAMITQSDGPLRCLLALMLPSLAQPRKNEKDQRVISLGLHVVRNLLAIKDLTAEGTAVGEKEEFANLQSTLIVQLNQLTFFQLILTLASCADKSDFNQYNVLVLDILHLIFRSVKTRDLGQDQARAPMENLTKLLDAEKRRKSLNSRTGMTRHSRFGTTVAVKAGEQKIVLHKQNAIVDSAGKILDGVKRKRAQRAKKMDELTHILDLSPDAMRVLQDLAKSFLLKCFNTFFESILKDIRMERSKIRPSDNIRTFYLSRFFVEYLLILRHKQSVAEGKKKELQLGLVAEMAEMDSVQFIFSRMRLTMDDKPPAWTELQACLDCFTQILLLIDAMSVSEEEEDIDIASKLQDQLYYNGDILDSSLSVVTQYKDQSVGYLDSVVHFAYVLLRMLEKFSKEKSYMFVRKRKAIRKKRKEPQNHNPSGVGDIPEEYAGEEEDIQPEREGPTYAEHAFRFHDFEKRFAQEPVTHTLLTYLARFQDFDDSEQMKRVVGLMHRQVVKVQAEGLYFKVSTLNLFRRILDEQQSLPKTDSSKDLLQLINFVLRKFFKRISDDPFLIVEAFAPKSRSKWKELSSYKSDEESDDGMGGQRARIKEQMGQVELEFKKNKKLSWSQQMGVVVAILVKDGHEDWIQWIISILELVLALRTEIVLTTDGQAIVDDSENEDEESRVRNFAGPSKEAMDKFVQHDLDLETQDQRTALIDQHFTLMLKLLSFDKTSIHSDQQNEEASPPLPPKTEWKWFVPSNITPSNISTSIGALKQFLSSPMELEEDPSSLLRKSRPARPRRPRSPSLELGSDGEIREKQKEKVKRKKKAVETQVFKSAAFIEDSDDEDDETTKRFFEREAELRREMDVLANSGLGMETQGRKKRKRDKGKQKNVEGGEGTAIDVASADDALNGEFDENDNNSEDDIMVGKEFSNSLSRARPAKRQSLARKVVSDSDSEDEDDHNSDDESEVSTKSRNSPGDEDEQAAIFSDEETIKPSVRTYGRVRRVLDPDDE